MLHRALKRSIQLPAHTERTVRVTGRRLLWLQRICLSVPRVPILDIDMGAKMTRGLQSPTSEKRQSEVHYAVLELTSESMGQLLPVFRVTSHANSMTAGRGIRCQSLLIHSREHVVSSQLVQLPVLGVMVCWQSIEQDPEMGINCPRKVETSFDIIRK